jgi:hypothetical protein
MNAIIVLSFWGSEHWTKSFDLPELTMLSRQAWLRLYRRRFSGHRLMPMQMIQSIKNKGAVPAVMGLAEGQVHTRLP